ncbi:MAG: hypothetical protein MMC23_006455 [Stictis urceolatum]|nr:hypothetical protein [Stictis urceolata]
MLNQPKALGNCFECSVKLLWHAYRPNQYPKNRRNASTQSTAGKNDFEPSIDAPISDSLTRYFENKKVDGFVPAYRLSDIDKLRSALLPSRTRYSGDGGLLLRWKSRISRASKQLYSIIDGGKVSLEMKRYVANRIAFHSYDIWNDLQLDEIQWWLASDMGRNAREQNKDWRIFKVKRSLRERREALRVFNIIARRHVLCTGTVTDNLVGAGLYHAVRARNVDTIRYYLGLASANVVDPKLPAHLGETMEAWWDWMQEDECEGWENRRNKQAIHMLFAGALNFPEWQGQGRCVLFKWNEGLEHRARVYLVYILGRLCGADAVIDAWTMYQRTEEYKRLSEAENEEQQRALGKALRPYLEALVWNGHPKVAWELVESLGWPAHRLGQETWNLLLDHPEYMTHWSPGMDDLVLIKYEEHVQRLEDTLGIRWSGGEDGSHVFVDEEGIEEDVDETLLRTDVTETTTT